MLHHPTWVEVKLDPNFPLLLKGSRGRVEWCLAENGNKRIIETTIPIRRVDTLIRGCFIVTGTESSMTIDNTTGILLSAGLFLGGVKRVRRFDNLCLSYNLSL